MLHFSAVASDPFFKLFNQDMTHIFQTPFLYLSQTTDDSSSVYVCSKSDLIREKKKGRYTSSQIYFYTKATSSPALKLNETLNKTTANEQCCHGYREAKSIYLICDAAYKLLNLWNIMFSSVNAKDLLWHLHSQTKCSFQCQGCLSMY